MIKSVVFCWKKGNLIRCKINQMWVNNGAIIMAKILSAIPQNDSLCHR